MLEGRRIVLGVTGGIAAYKAIELCRRLVDLGAHVSPIMTNGAKRFVGETTFSALASEPVQTSLWNEDSPIPHTVLGQNADAVIVAPATARFLGSYAAGISNDLLIATLLATRAPVIVCPAMHTEMWEHPSVEENIATLRRRGVKIVDPEDGRLAGGDVGSGRLASPDAMVAAVLETLTPGDLAGVPVLVTAGGTREPIDPVRFIGNRSSGKQGHAIAEVAAARGADVTLVTTTNIAASQGIEVVSVATAQEMHDAVMERSDTEVIVMAAAVADFCAREPADSKLKKRDGAPSVELVPTVDILAALGSIRKPHQTIVGFAAETDDVVENAMSKLVAKGADIIVANDVSAPNVGFEHETNAVTLISGVAKPESIPLASKTAIASAILDSIISHRSHKEKQ